MAIANFTNLDFDQIKVSIKDYLRSDSNFTDYDFEGSNLSTIIDVLAYNTYISSYNANMLVNETFIDSATLRENVVALARNIGYVPKSKKASVAEVTFSIDISELSTDPVSLTLRKGSIGTNVSYIFSIPDDITVPVIDNVAYFNKIKVYQGTLIRKSFIVDSNNKNQKFILDNPSIDTSSIRVFVKPSQDSSVRKRFIQSNSIFEIKSNSKVFFVHEIGDERYELIFGDGIIGEKLENLNEIEVSYIVTDGEEGNGVNSITYNGRVIDNDGVVVNGNVSLLTLSGQSFGGSEIESVESIRKFSTKIYAAQNRAVTAIDYESIVPKIYPEVQSISVYGGEDLVPPQFGKVFIAIKPLFGDFVPNSIKDNIVQELKRYSVAGILPEIVDLKYLFIEYDTSAYYNSNIFPGRDQLKNSINKNIELFAKSSELNTYGAKFKYSKFLNLIDNTHKSITSNITTISIRRDLAVKINKFAEYEICYGNAFQVKSMNGYNIKSSGFTVSGINETVYLGDLPDKDKKKGTVFLFTYGSSAASRSVKRTVGRINYETGEINLVAIKVLNTKKKKYGINIIQISASPRSNDIIGLQDIYLQLDVNNSEVDVVTDVMASGLDISGSTHISTPSYTNGLPIRL